MNRLRNIAKEIFFSCLTRKQIINYVYTKTTGKKMNWKHPVDFNEKINWLKLHSDTSLWTLCADKYKVRDFIKQKGYGDLLVPLLGKWERAEEIDFAKLPNRFVLKTNHGSGDVIVVKDKNKINFDNVRKILNKNLKTPYGKYQGESHYLGIPPCIIAEPLLIQNSNVSCSIIDYKIICFNGKPYCTLCFFNRKDGHYDFELHDLNWGYHPECLVFNEHSRDGKGVIDKPYSYDLMLKAASDLSKGFPQVRVDFYEIDGKPLLSELTFTTTGGCITYLTDDFLKELGEQIKLM